MNEKTARNQFSGKLIAVPIVSYSKPFLKLP